MSRVTAPAAAKAKTGPADEADDDHGTFRHVRTSVAAAGVTKPAGAVSSVFSQVPPPPKPARQPRRSEPLPPVETLVIETGVPIPIATRPGRPNAAQLLPERMLPGQSVVLTELQARNVRAQAAKTLRNVTVRLLGDGHARVWRLADKPASGARPGVSS